MGEQGVRADVRCHQIIQAGNRLKPGEVRVVPPVLRNGFSRGRGEKNPASSSKGWMRLRQGKQQCGEKERQGESKAAVRAFTEPNPSLCQCWQLWVIISSFISSFHMGISECSTNSHQPAHGAPAVTFPSQVTKHKCKESFCLLSKAKTTAKPCEAATPSTCLGTPSHPSRGADTGGSSAPYSNKPLRGSRGSAILISTNCGPWRKKDKACWTGRAK